MSFRDKLATLIAEDKKDEAVKVFDALDEQLDGYAADIRKLKTSLREKDGIKPEDFAALEKERDEVKAKLTDLEKKSKALEKERDDFAKKYDETSKKARDNERGVILREALSKHGIGKRAAEDIGDAIAHIERLVTYDDNGQALVKYKDGETEKTVSLSEYAEKVYPGTAHAKRFIPDGNGGAGAGQSSGGAGVKKMSIEAYNALKPKDQAAFMEAKGILE
jgi:hypothetical protein